MRLNRVMKKLLPITIVLAGLALVTFMLARKKPAVEIPTQSQAPQQEVGKVAESKQVVESKPQADAKSQAVAHTDAKPQGDASVPTAPNGAVAMPVTTEKPHCYRAVFKHKVLESHSDGEVCGHHKNLIHLPHEHVAMNSACVRVDSTPVKFESREQDLVLDPVAGPDSVVSITYCVGEACKAVSKAQCQPVAKANFKKKDEFMDAIGADGGGQELGNWEGKGGNGESDKKLNAALDPAIRREIAHLDDPKPKALKDAGLFAGWVKEEEEELKSCL